MATEETTQVPMEGAQEAAPTEQPGAPKTTHVVHHSHWFVVPARVTVAKRPDTTYARSIEGMLRIASVVSIFCHVVVFVDSW